MQVDEDGLEVDGDGLEVDGDGLEVEGEEGDPLLESHEEEE